MMFEGVIRQISNPSAEFFNVSENEYQEYPKRLFFFNLKTPSKKNYDEKVINKFFRVFFSF